MQLVVAVVPTLVGKGAVDRGDLAFRVARVGQVLDGGGALDRVDRGEPAAGGRHGAGGDRAVGVGVLGQIARSVVGRSVDDARDGGQASRRVVTERGGSRAHRVAIGVGGPLQSAARVVALVEGEGLAPDGAGAAHQPPGLVIVVARRTRRVGHGGELAGVVVAGLGLVVLPGHGGSGGRACADGLGLFAAERVVGELGALTLVVRMRELATCRVVGVVPDARVGVRHLRATPQRVVADAPQVADRVGDLRQVAAKVVGVAGGVPGSAGTLRMLDHLPVGVEHIALLMAHLVGLGDDAQAVGTRLVVAVGVSDGERAVEGVEGGGDPLGRFIGEVGQGLLPGVAAGVEGDVGADLLAHGRALALLAPGAPEAVEIGA